MGYLPKLTETSTSRMMTETFYGYDHNLKANDGTWFDEIGLSSRAYPLLAPRCRRGKIRPGDTDPVQMICKDRICWVGTDGRIYVDNVPVGDIVLADGDKQMVSMGAYLCVFPDGVYVNTQDLNEYGFMGNRVVLSEKSVKLEICNSAGETMDPEGKAIVSSTEPTDPQNGDLWIDTGDTPHVVKKYSAQQEQWVTMTSTYIRISAEGIGKGFKEQDGLRISGLHCRTQGGSIYKQVEALDADVILQKCEDDAIVIAGILDQTLTLNPTEMVLERRVPDMDFVCELDNRIWGCKYGSTEGENVNTIYACALGDPRNWYRYAGISTDSYAVNVGSDGPFTGMIAYGGYVLAFKEQCIHKVYGTLPSNFSVTTTQCRGIAQGSGRSAVIVNEGLYYLTRTGVVVYDGSTPTSVFSVFDGAQYSDGVAGVFRDQYYICMSGRNGKREVWTFDTGRGIWHHAYDRDVVQFCRCGSDLLALEADHTVWSESGENGEPEDPVLFDAISGIIGYDNPDHKYISRFVLRVKMGAGDELEVMTRYDSEGVWESQGIMHMDSTNSFALPVIPRRCDHMQIRLRGRGDIRIFSIAKVLEVGSDA